MAKDDGQDWAPEKGWTKREPSGRPSARPPKAPKNVVVRQGRYNTVRLAGLDEVNKNLKTLAKRMDANVKPAVVEIVSLIQKESMERTPIRTGFLRASHRSQVEGSKRRTIGTIFVLAYYALFVHEASPAVKFRSPWPRGRKFLERAITDNLGKILAIIQKWMTVK